VTDHADHSCVPGAVTHLLKIFPFMRNPPLPPAPPLTQPLFVHSAGLQGPYSVLFTLNIVCHAPSCCSLDLLYQFLMTYSVAPTYARLYWAGIRRVFRGACVICLICGSAERLWWSCLEHVRRLTIVCMLQQPMLQQPTEQLWRHQDRQLANIESSQVVHISWFAMKLKAKSCPNNYETCDESIGLYVYIRRQLL